MVTDLKSLTVMFSALKSFNLVHQRYQLQFAFMVHPKWLDDQTVRKNGRLRLRASVRELQQR